MSSAKQKITNNINEYNENKHVINLKKDTDYVSNKIEIEELFVNIKELVEYKSEIQIKISLETINQTKDINNMENIKLQLISKINSVIAGYSISDRLKIKTQIITR